jgi:hypothetical protein
MWSAVRICSSSHLSSPRSSPRSTTQPLCSTTSEQGDLKYWVFKDTEGGGLDVPSSTRHWNARGARVHNHQYIDRVKRIKTATRSNFFPSIAFQFFSSLKSRQHLLRQCTSRSFPPSSFSPRLLQQQLQSQHLLTRIYTSAPTPRGPEHVPISNSPCRTAVCRSFPPHLHSHA